LLFGDTNFILRTYARGRKEESSEGISGIKCFLTREGTAKPSRKPAIGSLSLGKCLETYGSEPVTLTLAVRSPQTIELPAVIDVLVAGSISLFFLDGADQILFGQFGVILHPQTPGFGSDIF
jgi:hypothetical protein